MTPIVQWLANATFAWVSILTPSAGSISPNDLRHAIVRDVFEVVTDSAENPLFGGPHPRTMTALYLLSVASFEGGFHPGVDSGRIRGDGGHSWCHTQILIGAGKTTEGWTGPDLIADRKKCFRAALHILHTAKRVCPYLKPQDRFSVYATGRCVSGVRAVRSRYERALSWYKANLLSLAPNAP